MDLRQLMIGGAVGLGFCQMTACAAPELRGASIAEVRKREMPIARYRESRCADEDGVPFPPQGLGISLERAGGSLVLRLARPDGVAMTLENHWRDAEGLVFQAIAARAQGYAVLWDFRIPDPTEEVPAGARPRAHETERRRARMTIADRFAEAGDGERLRAIIARAAVFCWLDPVRAPARNQI